MSPDTRAARFAARQAGNITRRQLRSCGLSHADVQARIRRGTLIRRFQGVFALGHIPEGRFSLAFAAWLAYGSEAALSHRDCAAVYEILDEPAGPVHVSRPTGGRSQGGTVLHEADVADDLWPRRGLLLTSPTRLVLDLAATEPQAVVERAWNEAQVRRLVTPAQLRDALNGWEGRRGVAVLRSFLDDRGAARSVLEDEFRRLVRAAGLPQPEMNIWIDGVLVDAVWREQRVIVELDGAAFHGTRRAFERDRRKTNALQLRGWIVLRFTHRRVRRAPLEVVAELVSALQNSGLERRPPLSLRL